MIWKKKLVLFKSQSMICPAEEAQQTLAYLREVIIA